MSRATSEAARALSKLGAKKGGKARFKAAGKTDKERRAHMAEIGRKGGRAGTGPRKKKATRRRR